MSGPTETDRPVVLAVDDRERVVQSFEIWLRDDYEVVTTADGESALARMDDTVDVVLLDRHMPGLSGDEVLREIRDAGYDCRVAMVTGVNPDFEVAEMPFDEYVQKPLDREALRETVARLLTLSQFDDGMEELYSLSQRRATLEAEKTEAELRNNDAYRRLCERQASLRESLDTAVAAADADALAGLLENGGAGSGDEDSDGVWEDADLPGDGASVDESLSVEDARGGDEESRR